MDFNPNYNVFRFGSFTSQQKEQNPITQQVNEKIIAAKVTPDVNLTADEDKQTVLDYIENHANSTNVNDDELNNLLVLLERANIAADITSQHGQTSVEFDVDDKHYTIVSNESVSGARAAGNSENTELINIIQKFASGNLSPKDFKEAMAALGVDIGKSTEIVTGSGTSYHYVFTYNDVTYHVKCNYDEAIKGDDNKNFIAFDREFIVTLKSLLSGTNINVSDLFEVTAWEGENKNNGALIYILKQNISGITENSTPQQVANILKDNNPADKINELIEKFTEGNLSPKDFRDAMTALGVDIGKSTEIVTGSGTSYHYKFTYNNVTYHVKCDYDEAIDGEDDKTVQTYDTAFIKAIKNLIEEDDVLKYMNINVDSFFTKVFWTEPDKGNTKYALNSTGKEIFGNSTTAYEFINALKASDECQVIINIYECVKNDNLDELIQKNGKDGLNLIITKNGNEYDIRVSLNGKDFGTITGVSDNNDLLEANRSFTQEEFDAVKEELKVFFVEINVDENTKYYKLDSAKIQQTYSSLELSEELKTQLTNVNTLAKLEKFLEDVAEYEKTSFRDQFDLGAVDGYNDNKNVQDNINGFDYRSKLIYILKNGINDKKSLYEQLQDFLGSDFKHFENALETIIQKYKKTGSSVKEAIDELLEIIRTKVNKNSKNGNTDLVTLNAEENAFINDINPAEILGGSKYNSGFFEDVGDFSDEIEAEINRLKTTLENKFKALLGDKFNSSEFNTMFDAALLKAQMYAATSTVKISVKDVINYFLKEIFTTYKAKESSTLQADIDAINPSSVETYNKQYKGVTAQNIESLVSDIVESLKNKVKTALKLTDDELNSVWETAIQKVVNYYKNSINGSIDITGSDVINLFIKYLIPEANSKKSARLDVLKQKAGLNNISDYKKDYKETFNANEVNSAITSILNNSALKNNLKLYITGSSMGFTENAFNKMYSDAINEVIKYFTGTGGAVEFSRKEVIDKLLEILNSIIAQKNPTDTLSDIDLNTIDEYKNSVLLMVRGGSITYLDTMIKDASIQICHMLDKVKDELKQYIEIKLGINITDEQYKAFMTEFIFDVLHKNSGLYTYNENGNWNKTLIYNFKDVTDALIAALPQYVQDNNPANKKFTKDELLKLFTDAEIENSKYFELDSDGNYKFNSNIESEFKNYIAKYGHIISLEDLRNAINYNTRHDLTLTEKANNIKNSLNSTISSTETIKLTFKVNYDGSVTFVNENGDIFAADTSDKNDLFNTKLKNTIFSTYSSELKALFGAKYESMSNKLFNLALLMTLQNETELYKDIKIEDIALKVAHKFFELMQKVQSDDKAYDYVKNYPYFGLLAGAQTDTFSSDLYEYESTDSGDDYIFINPSINADYTNDLLDSTEKIIHINISGNEHKKDNMAVNGAIDRLCDKYIDKYHDIIDPSRIVELYVKAEQNALDKLQKGIDSDDSAVYENIYGYGDTGNRDSYDQGGVSVQAVLIQIMYEMDKLINKEILG